MRGIWWQARDEDAYRAVSLRLLLAPSLHLVLYTNSLLCNAAELVYRSTRLVRRRDHKGRLVFGLAGQEFEIVSERGRGGLGTIGGSGERELVKQRAALKKQTARLREELRGVQLRRERQRQRRSADGQRTVAVVGYTNAGKSSLMMALTGKVRWCLPS
jgi:GTPase